VTRQGVREYIFVFGPEGKRTGESSIDKEKNSRARYLRKTSGRGMGEDLEAELTERGDADQEIAPEIGKGRRGKRQGISFAANPKTKKAAEWRNGEGGGRGRARAEN